MWGGQERLVVYDWFVDGWHGGRFGLWDAGIGQPHDRSTTSSKACELRKRK